MCISFYFCVSANVILIQTGANYADRANHNNLLELEWMLGELEMMKEEYMENLYCPEQLRTETGWLVPLSSPCGCRVPPWSGCGEGDGGCNHGT